MELVSISQAAKQLGCCAEHVRRMVRAGKWPAYRLGPKATRIDVDEVRALGRLIQQGEREKRAANEDS